MNKIDKMQTSQGLLSGHDRYNMDGHKLHWHLDRVAAWQNGERVAPLHVDMGISTGCNMACTYCYGVLQGRAGYGTDNKGKFNMPEAAITRFFGDAKETGIRSIALIGEGENTLNPVLYDVIDYAQGIELDLSLATNGIRIDHDRLDSLLGGLSWVRINISAASHEAFRNIHKVDQFDRVLGNIRAMVDAKHKNGYKCTIGLQMVVTHENDSEIVPLAKLGGELGADYLVIKSCSDDPLGTLDAPTNSYSNMTELFQAAEQYQRDDYVVSVKWHKLGNAGWKDYDVCFGTQFIIAISGDGSVFPCGHWFNDRRDEFILGNIIETPFSEILESQRYWDVQEKIQSVDVNRECETNCRQHYINRYLSQINQTPTHKNFI